MKLSVKRLVWVASVGVAIASSLLFLIWLATRIAEFRLDWSFVIPSITFASLVYPALQAVLDWLNKRVERETREIREAIADQREEFSRTTAAIHGELDQLSEDLSNLRIALNSHKERPAHDWAGSEIKLLQKVIYKVEARIATLQESLNRERLEDLAMISREILHKVGSDRSEKNDRDQSPSQD